jgi:DNA-binding winged helix-turn-helix (wHTH) protein
MAHSSSSARAFDLLPASLAIATISGRGYRFTLA